MCQRNTFRKGFTLLEVLVVIIIAILVFSFSVPVYRKTQEKNRYLAAQGVLIDLANGTRMVRAEYPSISSGTLAVTSNGGSGTEDLTGPNAVAWMMEHKYINPIRFESGNSYMGYSFAISLSGNASCENCSGTGVACMASPNNEIAEYKCAYVTETGEIKN